MINRQKFIVWHLVLLSSLRQIIFSLEISFSTQRKSSPMHSHRLLASQLSMNNYSLFWVDVLRLQNISGLICANRQNGKIKRAEHSAYFFKYPAIASISRVKNLLIEGSLNHKTSPKSCIEIVHPSFGPMTHGNESNLINSIINHHIDLLHPVKQPNVRFTWHHINRTDSSHKQRLKTFL